MSSAAFIRANLPCSIELPAGCGKTETITELVALFASEGKRSLVLTHTHAGVDALRRRCRRLGVPNGAVSIRTIDSWCFDLIGSFPQLADIQVGPDPDWSQSDDYYVAGGLATATSAVHRMLVASYELLVVDEYQDCQSGQHALITSIAQVVPTCVFGDRMQGLFFFSGASVIWESDVEPIFPVLELPVLPWRWHATNPALGEWLLDARRNLLSGNGIDLSTGPIALYGTADRIVACRAQPKHPARTAAIAKWSRACATLARRLGDGFTMIEEIEGNHLLEFADFIDDADPEITAAAALDFAVSCAFGVAEHFNAACRRRIVNDKSLDPAKFGVAASVAQAVNVVMDHASPATVGSLLQETGSLPKFRLYRREAWHGIREALRIAEATEGLSVRAAVVHCRNKVRMSGRYPESRIIARPLLIKGLEFDHVVVTDPREYDAHELYVCLTRGSTTLSVVTSTKFFSPPRPY